MATYQTPAQAREDLDEIIRAAEAAQVALEFYEDVFADDLSEEVVRLLRVVSVNTALLRRRHIAAHREASVFADAVFSDLAGLPVTAGPERHEDHDDWHKTEEGDQ